MKILQVITSLRIGGAEKLISEISPMLRNRGYHVDVCVFDGVDTHLKRSLIDAGIKIISFGENCNVYNPLFIFKLWKLMRGYDIIHTHNTAPQVFAAVARLLCSSILVTTEHSTSNRRRDWGWYASLDKWMYSQYNAVICISDKTEENLVKFIGRSKTQIRIISNGINVSAYMNAPSLRDAHRDRIVITMVAGFRNEKDQDSLINAFSLLNKEKYELWLVGDGERRKEIESLITELRLDNNVKLLGIRSDVPSILKSSDIIVMSSHWEGFGLAAVEGMAAGKPVIATDIPGLAQVVSGAGLLFPHQDVQDLADKIKRLSNDRSYYEIIAQKCSQRAKEFDITKMVDAYEQVYKLFIE